MSVWKKWTFSKEMAMMMFSWLTVDGSHRPFVFCSVRSSMFSWSPARKRSLTCSSRCCWRTPDLREPDMRSEHRTKFFHHKCLIHQFWSIFHSIDSRCIEMNKYQLWHLQHTKVISECSIRSYISLIYTKTETNVLLISFYVSEH